jgi:hypothetical protein
MAWSSPPLIASEGRETTLSSEANRLVWRRMKIIAEDSGLRMETSRFQNSLFGAPKLTATTRLFRHKFRTDVPELLVREDVFKTNVRLLQAAVWRRHKNPVFLCIRTDDLQFLDRTLDAVRAFALGHGT